MSVLGRSLISLSTIVDWCRREAFSFFDVSYLNLPKSMILQTGGIGPRIDFDQLEPLLLGEAQSLVGRDDADLGAVGADDADLGDADAAADSVVVRRARWG